MLPWQKKAMIFDIPRPPNPGTRAHSPKPPFYRTALLFPLDQNSELPLSDCVSRLQVEDPQNLRSSCSFALRMDACPGRPNHKLAAWRVGSLQFPAGTP